VLLAGLALAAAAALISFRQVYEPDLWWHLAQGRENLSGHFVRTNLFSFIYPDYRQHYTSWLFDSFAFGAWQVAGGAGIQIFQWLALSAALILTYRACRVSAPPAAAAAVLVLAWVVIEPRAIPRPHLVSFAGLAGCALLVARASATGTARPLLWTIPLIALWANFHVEAVFGAALVGLFAGSELLWPRDLTRQESRRALLYAAAASAATMATPYGVGLLRYLFENTAVPGLFEVAELQRPYLPAYRAFYVYLGIGAILLLLQPRRLRPWELAAAVFFAILGLRYLRLTPLVVFATAPVLAARLGVLMSRGLSGWAALVTSLAAAILLARLPPAAFITELAAGTPAVRLPGFFSINAIEYARARQLSGPVFNSGNLGGFVAWELYPTVRTFQDARFQSYPPEHFVAITRAFESQLDWDALVSGVDWAVISRARPNALSGAGRFPHGEWPLVYWDNGTEIVVRRGGRFGHLAATDEYWLLTPDADPAQLETWLASPLGDRLRAEARRNRADNPRGFLAAATLCLDRDQEACRTLADLTATPEILQPQGEAAN
jgi:hypothetical protein